MLPETPINLAVRLKNPGRGRLPEFKNLKKKTPEELLRTLDRFGLKPNVKEFERRAKRVYEQQLEQAIEGKGFPDKETWKSIDEQLNRAATNTLREQTHEAIRQYRKHRMRGLAKFFVWIAVMDKGTCVSCDKRHGKRKTIKQWEAYGEPGSAVLVCQNRCRCVLQPDIVESGPIPEDVADAVSDVVEEIE